MDLIYMYMRRMKEPFVFIQNINLKYDLRNLKQKLKNMNIL